MKRHPFDPLSFAGGVIFLLIAGTVAFSPDIDLRAESWLIPTSVLVLGIGILTATVRTMARPATDDGSGTNDGRRTTDDGTEI